MKMKTIVSFLLALVLVVSGVFGTLVACAETEYTFSYEKVEGGVCVTQIVGSGILDKIPASVVIPDTIEDLPVVAIGTEAFKSRSGMTSVSIPKTVTSIGDGAFFYCIKLTSITLPVNLVSIGEGAFASCSGLTAIQIPESVTFIGTRAFDGCESLKTANLPVGLVSLGEKAFYGCKVLESAIVIPEGIDEIGNQTFYGCEKIPSVTIGNNVAVIGDYAFKNCGSLTSVEVPTSVIELGYAAFSQCKKLTEVTIGNSMEMGMLNSVFENSPVKTLSILKVEDTITYNFINGMHLSKVESITISDGVTTIEEGAFLNLKELAQLNIPDSVTNIGDGILNGTRLYDTASNWDNGVLYVGNHLIDVKTNCESDLTLRDGVLTIAKGAFNGNILSPSAVTVLRIPDSVKFIGDETFGGCYNMEAVIYNGSEEQWKSVNVGRSNEKLTDLVPIYTAGGSYGDVNIDKKIDAKDALEILKNAVDKVKFNLRQTIVSDVDVDGKINAKDALNVLKKAVGKIEWFPVELAAQTPDVTPTDIQ